MSYPDELLPKSNYKIIDLSHLSDNHYIIRTPIKTLPEDRDEITYDYFCKQSSDLFGLSINLLGIFKPSHIKYKPVKHAEIKYHAPWDPSKGEVLRPEQVDFEFEQDPLSPLFIKVLSLHNREFPYDKKIGNVSEEFTGTITIDHWPTLCNFWHCQLTVKEIDGVVIEKNSAKNYHKRAAGFMLESIAEDMIILEEPEIEPLPPLLYIKAAENIKPAKSFKQWLIIPALVMTSFAIVQGFRFIRRKLSRGKRSRIQS